MVSSLALGVEVQGGQGWNKEKVTSNQQATVYPVYATVICCENV
jgi:hypothetical protein